MVPGYLAWDIRNILMCFRVYWFRSDSISVPELSNGTHRTCAVAEVLTGCVKSDVDKTGRNYDGNTDEDFEILSCFLAFGTIIIIMFAKMYYLIE